MQAVRRLCRRIIECTGWTLDAVRATALDDATWLVEEWAREPTWQDAVKVFLGVKRNDPEPVVDATPKEMTAEEWEREKAAGLAFAQRHGNVRGF